MAQCVDVLLPLLVREKQTVSSTLQHHFFKAFFPTHTSPSTYMRKHLHILGASLLLTAAPLLATAGTIVSRDSASYYMDLGRTELAARRYSNAWRFMEKAGQFAPQDATIQQEIADVCFKMNKPAPAIKALESAYAINPSDAATLKRLTELYFKANQWGQTLSSAAKVKSKGIKMEGLDFMIGKAHYSLQDYGQAIPNLKAFLKENPDNAEANYFIARSLVVMSNYAQSIPYYEKSLSIDPEQPTRCYEYAMVLSTSYKADESIEWFQKALDKGYKPRDDFYMNMAYTMADAKKTDEAVAMLDRVLARRPQDISLLFGIADVCYHSKQYKKAISYWDRVLEVDKGHARALYMIGMSYMKMGKNQEGIALCDRAISMDPSLAALKRKRELM